ncbi:E3 ubiquitin-protein ligase rnf8-A [Drosophila subpulchrella]|uniref:E3 ubiquitin-protein ligase rnf8-A n=1 Tax=Drosophila subpulchrella TaxID=1486046 RepID=UPI0018A19389|nr:E3 ubiquitin-protein ligase rnf8-A [Drosophila subpulchrella]
MNKSLANQKPKPRSISGMLKREVAEEIVEQRKLGAQLDRQLTEDGNKVPTLKELRDQDNELFKQLQEEMEKTEVLRQRIKTNKEAVNNATSELRKKLDIIDQENSCCICLLHWSARGHHRLVSLKCGHLFGEMCIRTYWRQSNRCPICRVVSYEDDIRQVHPYNCDSTTDQ